MEQTQLVGATQAWALRRNRPRTPVELQDSALAAIVRSSQDAVIAKTLTGVVTEWNDGAAHIYGHPPETMIGRNIEEMIPLESLAAERARHARVAAGASESGIHCTRRRVDGTPIDIVMSMSPVRDNRGVVVGMASISRPVSDDERSDARFRSLLEAAPDAIVCVDRSGRIAIVNAQASLIFGYSREELIGSPVELLLPEQARAGHVAHRERFTAAPRQRPMGAGLALEARRKDGSVFPVEVSLSANQERTDGEDSLVVAAVRDVTSQREIEQALRDAVAAAQAANEAKNQFLSRMSHELRTPLNAVLGFGQLLSRQLADTEYAEAVGHIVKGGRHLLDLINDVLDIARIESGEMSISSEPVPVAGVVEETLQLMQPLADAAGVALSLSADASDDYVLVDRQRLRQILLNLLSNAIKYNRPGGHVWLGWHAENGQVALGVRDDGPGIDPLVQHRLFTPFDRLGAEVSGVDGTGIGLALTRSLAEMMGGAIEVESSPGQGSTFTITLKSAQAHKPSRTHPVGSTGTGPGATGLAPAMLLYIEDNAPNVRVVEHLLRLRPEWKLVHAALGSLGIELAEAHQPDLVLLDLHLPDRSGHQVLRAIRALPATASIPVVVLTADASAGLAHRLRDSGATGYLTKPLDIDQVLEFLDGVTREKPDMAS